MSFRLQTREGNEPRRGRAPDAASTESEMTVGNLQHNADIQQTVTPDRRLRNWLLLGNLLAWVLIIVALQWLLA